MKKMFFLGMTVFLILGCAEKPLATSVTQLAGNQKIVGWDNGVKKPVKKVIFSPVKKIYPKDSDKDGVVDYLDRCPNTPLGVNVNHYGCPIITTLRFNFDFNKANVKHFYLPQIEKIAKTLKANPNLKIEIDGYTDNVGSSKYNLKLSKKRAEAVKDILVNKYHIDPSRIIVQGFGEKYPLVPNTTETNRAINRRVEIIGIENNKKYVNTDLNMVIN